MMDSMQINTVDFLFLKYRSMTVSLLEAAKDIIRILVKQNC